MKKLIALLLALVMVLGLVACGSSSDDSAKDDTAETEAADTAKDDAAEEPAADDAEDADTAAEPVDTADFKIGAVLVGDENEGYTYAHIEGIKEALSNLGLSEDNVIWYYSIPEDETCYDKCVDLADQGCSVVFTNSYGHQTYALQAAEEFPDVQFVSMTGDQALASGLDNYCNAFTKIYEARYVSGVVAGMKIAELVENNELSDKNYDADGKVKVGYVGAYPYAEVVSGYTAFFLGIQSVYENVSMEVQYTNSWFDITAENEAAKALVADGCAIIGQHADSTGAPAACEELLTGGTVAYSVGYNVDMLATAPTAALTSATNNWSVYYTYAIGAALNGEKIDTNWAAGFEEEAVAITALGDSCAEGTADKVAEVEAAIHDGTLHVFDTATFTAPESTDGSYVIDDEGHVTSAFCYDSDGDFVYDTGEAITDGYYNESAYQSAPSFTIRINGITELN